MSPLKKFNIKSMELNASVLLLGRRRSGKSYLVRDIFYHHKEIPTGLIFSGTEEVNPFYSEFIPDSFIHSEYNSNLVETMLTNQSQKVKTRINGHADTDGLTPNNRAFIVLDDMLHDAATCKNIQSIFFNGRHYNLFFILTMSYPLGIPPALRSNIDYVFVFNEPNIRNRKKLYDYYGSGCDSFDSFCNILDRYTDNHECIVIKPRSGQIFWYKAGIHNNFTVASHSFDEVQNDFTDSDENIIVKPELEDVTKKANALKSEVPRTWWHFGF
jgi:hypothetical protein